MQLIEYQYFREISTNLKSTVMHDLKRIYKNVRKHVRLSLKHYLVEGQNLRFYPNPPKMNDIDIIALSITSECLGIDSENLLWSKLKTDYSSLFPHLIHRTNYNRRKKQLGSWILDCAQKWRAKIPMQDEICIVDSMPLPVCKISRERSSKVCRQSNNIKLANKGYSAVNKQYYIGYKLHLIACSLGVYQHHELRPASEHDITFLKELNETHLIDTRLIGDRAYRSAPLQMELFEWAGINLDVPYRRNQHDFKPYPKRLQVKRKMIETVFSQYCDDLHMKRNYAKTYQGLSVRVNSKISAMTFKQYWNFLHGNKISETKHYMAA